MTIKAIYIPSQTDVDFFARNAADQWWNTSGTPAFEAYNPANLASYRIAATESPAGSGIYAADEPTGTVEFELRVRGATLADSVIVAGPAKTDAAESATLLDAIKADADLGTATGGMVANTEAIKAKTDLIGSGALLISAPVSGDGDLLELILETDYLAANGRALEWTFDEITGITTSATGKFGLKDADTGTEVYVNTTGTVTDLGSGTFKVSFNITNTALDELPPGKYDWSVEVLEGSYKITVARNRQIKTRVDIVEKQT